MNQSGIWKKIIAYSVPLIIANLLQSFYGLTDFFLAGHYIGDTGLSAINNGSQIMALYTGIIIGLSTGGNVLIGQYAGACEREKRDACTGSFVMLFIILGAIVAVGLFVFAEGFMDAMNAPAQREATAYIRFCAPGALAIAGYNAMAATFRGIGDSKRPLFIVSVSVLINILLDILLMGVFRMGVEGAAAATTLSQYVSFLTATWLLLHGKGEALRIPVRLLRCNREYVLPILRIGFPTAVQMTVASVSWLSVTFLLNRYGVAVSAAAGISAKVKDMVQTVTAALSIGATSLIAQQLGAKEYERALEIMYKVMLLAVCVSIGLIVVVETGAPQMVGLFTTSPRVIRAGVWNLRIEIPAQILYAVFLTYHALMSGAGHTKLVLFSSFTNCILVRMVLAIIFARFWNETGVYVACLIAPAISVPIGMVYTRSGKWRRSLV